MTRCFSILLLCLLTACHSSGAGKIESATASPSAMPTHASPGVLEDQHKEMLIADYYGKTEQLEYNGYQVVKIKEKVKDGSDVGLASSALLKRNGQVVYKFDSGVLGPQAIDFGLFPFLSKESKQLAVSWTAPRTGRHWIVELSNQYRVLFDSADYEVGREDLGLIDLDKDGVYEISLPVVSFYFVNVGNLSMSSTPLPEVIFRYNKQARKYLPANHLFKAYSLRGIDEERAKLSRETGETYLGDTLKILLRYLYAGEEKEGWAFFESEYKQPDKEVIKAQVKAVLKKAAAYSYIRKHSAK